jgi:two-component system, OmpR family, phosphate regulon sensor histidine kinase PhoR
MLISFTVLALLVWPLAGPLPALALYCALLLLALYRNGLHTRELHAWLRNPATQTIPEARGSWGESYALFARLLRSQRQSENTLSAALARFQQAGAAVPDGLIILREDDHIEWCNPAAEAHFGISRAKDEGQQITYLVRTPQFAEYIQAPNHSEPLMLRLVRDIDRTLVLSVQLVPFGDKQRLILSRDITRMEAVETMRRDFVANVSHELRTPLTVVLGFLETVLDMKGIPQAAMRPLTLAMDQAGRMQRLVDDLLTLSRLESEDNPLREDSVDVPALVRVLHQEAVALSGARHRVQLVLQSQASVRGSVEELRSAFGNLVTNAIRYTPDGGEITLRWQETGEQVQFVVEDSGIGIEPQHIPRLTERFYRVDRSRSRETGGTGLGLAIVKHVVTRHHARLQIESRAGEGSRFTVTFPASRIVPASASAERAEDRAA